MIAIIQFAILLAEFCKILERTISVVDLLEMMLKGSTIALYPYHSHLPGFQKTHHNVCTVSKCSFITPRPASAPTKGQRATVTCTKKFIIIGRAKRAPHWGVQSRFRVIYISL